MKIVYFHQYFSTPNGSAGIRSYYLAKKLVEEGNQVVIVCLNDKRTDCGLNNSFVNNQRRGEIEGIKIIQLDINYSNSINFVQRSLIFISYSFRGIKLAFEINPNLIIASSTPLTVAIPAIILRWIYGTPFIFEVRDLWPKLPIAMGVLKNKIIIIILKLLENISYRSSDSIIALAPGIFEEIKKKKINKEKIHLIPNFADLDLFKPEINSEKKPELLKKYDPSINSSTLVAAFTGAHGLANGLENLLKVAEELKKMNRDDIKILFIGEGATKKKLIHNARFFELNNCIFIDSMPKNELAKILKESVHLGLMILKNIPDFYNGTSPNKFFDYLACGLPIINNYPGWLSQMITENKLGFAIPPEDNKKFAMKLIEIADNKKILLEISHNCINYAQKFNKNSLINKFYSVVNKTYKAYKGRSNYYIYRKSYDFFKEIIDRLIALLLIVLLSPFLALISSIVFIKLGLPIFFIQERPGLKNKIFKIVKFRSMKNIKKSNVIDVDDKLRIDNFGKFFRSTSLDELPELFNILKGDMSFVGPRPLLKEYLELYSEEQIKRHNVKPGITGLAQIKGRNLLDWEKKFNLDLYYVRNRNLFLDIKILIITFWKVISREGINSKNDATSKKFKGINKE